MVFNGCDQSCLTAVLKLVMDFISKKKVFEIIDRTKMTRSQRGLLHVYCGIVAKHFGLTIDYVKQNYYKGIVNPDVYAVTIHDPVTGEWQTTYRSSESLAKETISSTLERFKHWALNEHGIVLPDRNDLNAMNAAYVEVNRYDKQYSYYGEKK